MYKKAKKSYGSSMICSTQCAQVNTCFFDIKVPPVAVPGWPGFEMLYSLIWMYQGYLKLFGELLPFEILEFFDEERNVPQSHSSWHCEIAIINSKNNTYLPVHFLRQ